MPCPGHRLVAAIRVYSTTITPDMPSPPAPVRLAVVRVGAGLVEGELEVGSSREVAVERTGIRSYRVRRAVFVVPNHRGACLMLRSFGLKAKFLTLIVMVWPAVCPELSLVAGATTRVSIISPFAESATALAAVARSRRASSLA